MKIDGLLIHVPSAVSLDLFEHNVSLGNALLINLVAYSLIFMKFSGHKYDIEKPGYPKAQGCNCKSELLLSLRIFYI